MRQSKHPTHNTGMLLNYPSIFCNLGSLSLGNSGDELSLIFLGLGWNFLFIAGTSLLVLTYDENEKYKAQGLNDFVVYSVHALGSLSAGIFISLSSWKIMNLVCIPFIILIILASVRADIVDKKNPSVIKR